jgi:hypothetical protein
MTATNKRLLISESRGDSNRCTPCRGKSDQHATYASHSSSCTPGIRFLWAVPVHDNLSLAPMKLKQTPTAERSLGNQRLTDPAVILGGLVPPPMRRPWVGERSFDIMFTQLHQLTGPISLACNRYVQYLLVGVNPSVLNRHRRGLQPWRCRLAAYPLPNLPNQLSPLST